MSEKLTEAQKSCLRILGHQRTLDGSSWCNYGTACGVKRNVVIALEARGLAEHDAEIRPGVSARITEAGRLALKEHEAAS